CEAINFHEVAESIAEDVAQDHIADSMTFSYNVPDDCLVFGHKSLLVNAMLNLIYNAARHSGGTAISLDWIGERDGRQIFTFADNGIGVDPEHLGRLFDLFYRVDSGRSRKNGGSGLGLPLVQRIITAMGGEITVDNAPDGGLRFTFSLPVPR
ncbi:MAG: HAMP domain-containing histidine kinase, partial [Muribaculaceae bacterium]|nr:HAMP domain-containing histidine kinase [Muribaculaceae bacterium]